MTDKHDMEVSQMDAVGRLGVAIKRIAAKDAEIERLAMDRNAHLARAERAQAETEKLRARVSELVSQLDDQYGTPCEQIRHQQEIARLTVERDDFKADYLRRHKDVGNMMEEVIKLRADNARLRAALARYGDHEYECALKDEGDCSCGYEAAVLAGKEG